MSCAPFLPELAEVAMGEASPVVVAHVESCSRCAREVEAFRATISRLGQPSTSSPEPARGHGLAVAATLLFAALGLALAFTTRTRELPAPRALEVVSPPPPIVVDPLIDAPSPAELLGPGPVPPLASASADELERVMRELGDAAPGYGLSSSSTCWDELERLDAYGIECALARLPEK